MCKEEIAIQQEHNFGFERVADKSGSKKKDRAGVYLHSDAWKGFERKVECASFLFRVALPLDVIRTV